MKHASLVLALLAVAATAVAQEGPPLPKPGPEHEVLKNQVGTWDATVEITPAPGAPPMISKGVETSTLLGGLWLVTDVKADMMGQAFAGHGTTGWDFAKKKYVGAWVDSMSTGFSLGEATWDPATKTMTGWMEGPDMMGRIVKTKSVTEWKDADTRVFTMYMPGPDGKDVPGVKITYKRRN